MRNVFTFFILLFFSNICYAQIDSISNINVIQRTDGSKMIDIYYDLYGPEFYYNIEVQVSFDSGTIFTPINNLEGDWGVGVSPGTAKHVIWNAGLEYPSQHSRNTILKIISDREYMVCGYSKFYYEGYEYGTRISHNRCWLDRNLGATQVGGGYDSLSFGDAYQWGRLMDGHQYINSDTISQTSAGNIPGHDKFIVGSDDWRTTPNDNLWQGENGINNPCPSGFKIPTSSEWDMNLYSNNLSLPWTGIRFNDGFYYNNDYIHSEFKYYWSSTTSGDQSLIVFWDYFSRGLAARDRSVGLPIRCISDDLTAIEPPEYLSPLSGTTDTSEFTDITWTHDNTNVQFDVFFGSDPNPPLVAYHINDTTFDPGILEFNTKYYWRVVAFYPSGMATSNGVWNFTTRGFTCGSSVVEYEGLTFHTVQIDDRCWLDRNLGATDSATSYNHLGAFGDYYQWGRLMDGHQDKNSSTTTTLSNNNIPEDSSFIISTISPYDWRNPQNDSLWKGVNVINNPCPEGWKVPSVIEWQAVSGSWNNRVDAFNSLLKLSSSGYRSGFNGDLSLDNTGNYWVKDASGSNASYLYFDQSNLNYPTNGRSNGYSVRCIKSEPIQLPGNPFPSNDSLMQIKYIDLRWTCNDPDGDDLIYDIYFGEDTVPPLLVPGHPDTTYDLGMLEYNKTYYWKIIAKDAYGSFREGEIWKFTINVFNCGITTVELNDSIFGTVDYAGYCWLDRNLGASKVATAPDDTASYGSLYQWGRLTDGHENPNSSITYSLSDTTNPGHDKFIINNPDQYYFGWMYSPDPSRWQGVNGINNPCPNDWQVPNGTALTAAIDSLPNPSNPFDCPLKVPFGGYRNGNQIGGYPIGQVNGLGVYGSLWSSTMYFSVCFLSDGAWSGSCGSSYYTVTVQGFSVRCIKNTIKPDPPTNPIPYNGAIDQEVNITLSWSCSHPQGNEFPKFLFD